MIMNTQTIQEAVQIYENNQMNSINTCALLKLLTKNSIKFEKENAYQFIKLSDIICNDMVKMMRLDDARMIANVYFYLLKLKLQILDSQTQENIQNLKVQIEQEIPNALGKMNMTEVSSVVYALGKNNKTDILNLISYIMGEPDFFLKFSSHQLRPLMQIFQTYSHLGIQSVNLYIQLDHHINLLNLSSMNAQDFAQIFYCYGKNTHIFQNPKIFHKIQLLHRHHVDQVNLIGLCNIFNSLANFDQQIMSDDFFELWESKIIQLIPQMNTRQLANILRGYNKFNKGQLLIQRTYIFQIAHQFDILTQLQSSSSNLRYFCFKISTYYLKLIFIPIAFLFLYFLIAYFIFNHQLHIIQQLALFQYNFHSLGQFFYNQPLFLAQSYMQNCIQLLITQISKNYQLQQDIQIYIKCIIQFLFDQNSEEFYDKMLNQIQKQEEIDAQSVYTFLYSFSKKKLGNKRFYQNMEELVIKNLIDCFHKDNFQFAVFSFGQINQIYQMNPDNQNTIFNLLMKNFTLFSTQQIDSIFNSIKFLTQQQFKTFLLKIYESEENYISNELKFKFFEAALKQGLFENEKLNNQLLLCLTETINSIQVMSLYEKINSTKIKMIINYSINMIKFEQKQNQEYLQLLKQFLKNDQVKQEISQNLQLSEYLQTNKKLYQTDTL